MKLQQISLKSRTNHCKWSLLFIPFFMACLAPLVDKPVTFKLGNKCYFGFQTICWHQVMITALNSNGHSSGIYLDPIKFSSKVLSLWSQVCFRECWSQLCTCCDLKVRKKGKRDGRDFHPRRQSFHGLCSKPQEDISFIFQQIICWKPVIFLTSKGRGGRRWARVQEFYAKKGAWRSIREE